MKKSLNLSIIATIVIATLSMGSALAKSGQSSTLKSKNVNSVKADENVRC